MGRKMNIKVPNNIKSPTVIIVGGGQPDEKKNDMHAKQMCMLEKKLDGQYKAFMDNKNYTKLIETLHKSFMHKFDKMMDSNRTLMKEAHAQRLGALKTQVIKQVKTLPNNGNEKMMKSFLSQLTSLEKAINKISDKEPTVKVVRSGNINKSFETLITRLEKAIRESRPRVFPTPS